MCVGGKAVSCGSSLRSVAVCEAGVGDMLQEEEMAFFFKYCTTDQCSLSGFHEFLSFFLSSFKGSAIGAFWCIFIDAAVMNDKSQSVMDFS